MAHRNTARRFNIVFNKHTLLYVPPMDQHHHSLRYQRRRAPFQAPVRRTHAVFRHYRPADACAGADHALSRHQPGRAGRTGSMSSPSPTCRMVDRLEQADLVERRRDPQDRRAWQLFMHEHRRAHRPGTSGVASVRPCSTIPRGYRSSRPWRRHGRCSRRFATISTVPRVSDGRRDARGNRQHG